MQLVKYGDQVVLYAQRKDKRDQIMSSVESLTTQLVQTEEGEEPQQPQQPQLYPHLQPNLHLHAHHPAQSVATQGGSGLDGHPACDGAAAATSLDFDLPTSSSQLVAQHSLKYCVLVLMLDFPPGTELRSCRLADPQSPFFRCFAFVPFIWFISIVACLLLLHINSVVRKM